jgi:Concanavalin A-like lectin/glucanases superfamily
MKIKLAFLLVLIAFFAGNHHAGAQPVMLSWFKLNTDGQDSLSNSYPMDLDGVSFSNAALTLPNAGDYTASAYITGFSYTAFTVAFDFNPTILGYPNNTTLLIGGPAYRWFGLVNDALGHLRISINDYNQEYNFTNIITTNHWHTLVCSVSMNTLTILTMLDGQLLPPISLPRFPFNVIGTPNEQSDKAFTFWDYGDASFLSGQANNLRIFGGALTASEMSSLNAVNLTIQAFDSGIIVNWPSGLQGYVPQWTDSLQPPIQWHDDLRTPLTVGDQSVLIDTPAPSTKFYRLRRL